MIQIKYVFIFIASTYLKKFTISFIRHGPRTPLKYCVDNYYDETPCGEITKLG
jgi:hypothetical protein